MFATDNSGIFWGLSSLIIIVFVAIGLSSLTERRFEFSSSSKNDRLAIQADASLLTELTDQKQTAEATLARIEKPRYADDTDASQLEKTSRTRKDRLETLKADFATAKAARDRVESQFAEYRESYRNQTWLAAAGEKIPVIQLRSGRQYQNASIVKVTTVGLEINYADGRARIDATELDDTWQQRFQWNDSERKSALKLEELAGAPRPSAQPKPAPVPVGTATVTPVRNEEPDQPSKEEIQKLRADLSAWNYKVSQLDAQYAEARTKSQSGSPSVPGSLETWAARVSRLGNDLERARNNQVRSKARLSIVAPNDPLLLPQ